MLTPQRFLGDEIPTSLVRNLGLMDKQSLKGCILMHVGSLKNSSHVAELALSESLPA